MADCPSGTFCGNADRITLRIFSEHHISVSTTLPIFPICRDCAYTGMSTTTAEEVCPAALGPDKWEHREYLDFDHQELWMTRNTGSSTLQECISFLHCSTTDLDADTDFEAIFDFIALTKSKMDGWRDVADGGFPGASVGSP
eukprot:CAMPEP_0194308286 /NCGR_PEP_ID=MMETSP0171-20130528/5256_1 /TAXON_ID=218684 /ORGANISM="Corethron pennatum, Strain L29A3" /LENGTH=141 /DNA_ID=CAMNT_0039060837 /DNA_START=47 /DNA_END=469 /DNA_ORIENTATION=+